MKGIYKITNPSGKIYIGQSVNIERRWKHYKYQDAKNQPALKNSLLKYGWDAHGAAVEFQFVENISQDWLNYWEAFFLNYYKQLGYEMLNIREAGNKKLSEETKEKIRKASLGKKMSPEARQRMSEVRKGVKYTQERLDKLHQRLKNNPRPVGEDHPLFGRRRAQADINRLASSNRGRKRSDETRALMSKSRTTPIVCVNTGEIFTNATEAALKIFNDKRFAAKISEVKRGKRDSYKGLVFRYVE